MTKVKANILLAISLGLAMSAGAQNLDMGAGDRSATFEQSGKPSRGMTQAGVQSKYGAPQNTRAPIGEPPITRWEYADFVVFFEFDRVIHAVSKK